MIPMTQPHSCLVRGHDPPKVQAVIQLSAAAQRTIKVISKDLTTQDSTLVCGAYHMLMQEVQAFDDVQGH